jgi:aminoglycoside 3-N-acetyltransferase
MHTLDDIVDVCAELLGDRDDRRPVVVFAAIWPLTRLLGTRNRTLPDRLCARLETIAGDHRSLLMPTFVPGYTDGLCDLDTTPSNTGQLSEAFRQRPGVRRTVSAFFPFAVRGPDADAVIALRPQQAWGTGSLYEWFERTDARFLMLGTHPTHCSYLHRMEQLVGVPYRYMKNFSGSVRHEGQELALTEELYVRTLDPLALNDFTMIAEALRAGGMKTRFIDGLPVNEMGAIAMRDAFLPILQADPLCVVQNRDAFTHLLYPAARSIAQ